MCWDWITLIRTGALYSILILCGLDAVYAAQAKVAIIGGGMSGLSAAYTISKGDDGEQKGWKVDLFEATNRLGGRVWSGSLCTQGQCQTMEYGGELIDSSHETVLHYAKKFQLGLDDRIGCTAPEAYANAPLMCAHKASHSSPTGFVDENNQILPPLEPNYSVLDAKGQSVNYSLSEAQDDWYKPSYSKGAKYYLNQDATDAHYPTNYLHHTKLGLKFDRMPLNTYLESLASKGISNKFIQLIRIAYVGELGLEMPQQSTLNMLYQLGMSGKILDLYGESDERYHITGGNELLISKLKKEIVQSGSRINLNHRLIKIERLANGTYKLTFDHPMSAKNSQEELIYDRVVLAIPFAVMRDMDPTTGDNLKQTFGWSVDLSKAGFSPLKMKAIKQLPMGKNAKIIIQFNKRFWRAQGNSGETYATAYINNNETQYQNTWESTLGQKGEMGILVNYVSANKTKDVENSQEKIWWDPLATQNPLAVKTKIQNTLEQIDKVLPGADAEVNFTGFIEANNLNSCDTHTSKNCELFSNVVSVNWAKNPYTRGSYAAYGPGQYSAFAGIEATAEPCFASDPEQCFNSKYQLIQRNVHFAGEQTSIDFIGYIEGAALSGQRAGNEVRAALNAEHIPMDTP